MPDSDALRDAPPSQATSLGLGERLRSARRARAISVAQIADALRVEESIVLALEEERFEALGAPVFVRGHLRRYAEAIGLSPETVLEAYRTAVPDSDRLPLVARHGARTGNVEVASWVYWLIAALLLVGLVIVLGNGGGETEQGPAAPQESPATRSSPAAVSPLRSADRLPPESVDTTPDGTGPAPAAFLAAPTGT